MSHRASKRFGTPAGHIALDFVNTLDNRFGTPEEHLPSYHSLVAWAEEKQVIDRSVGGTLIDQAIRTPGQATNTLQDAIRLREALYEIFCAVIERRVVPQNALGTLNFSLQDAGEHARLVQRPDGLEWDWIGAGRSLYRILWVVARAAADLLMSPEVARVRQCDSRDCAWLFLDTTRNGRRRWCDMKTCGNRVKARRHYERVRSGG